MYSKAAYQLFIILIAGIFLSCNPTKIIMQDDVPGNKILFLAYELKKDSATGNVSANLVQQIFADGVINEEIVAGAATANDLLIVFSGDDGTVIKQHVIKDPLTLHVEGIGEGNKLERKAVKQNGAEVTLRTNHSSKMQKIVLHYIDEKGIKKAILQHQLTYK